MKRLSDSYKKCTVFSDIVRNKRGGGVGDLCVFCYLCLRKSIKLKKDYGK